jgi:hypothetical protein
MLVNIGDVVDGVLVSAIGLAGRRQRLPIFLRYRLH